MQPLKQHPLKRLEVFVVVEDRQTAVATVHHVVDLFAGGDAGGMGHNASVSGIIGC